jgi:hypothetical protein
MNESTESREEAFKKTVLMALATLMSETYRTNQMLAEIRSGQPIKSWEDAQASWQKEAVALQQLTYDHLLQEAELPPDDPGGGSIVVDCGGPN